MRIFPGAVAAALAAISIAALPADSALAQSTPATLTKVVFSLDFIPLGRHAPWYAAVAEGFFREEGLDVSEVSMVQVQQAHDKSVWWFKRFEEFKNGLNTRPD